MYDIHPSVRGSDFRQSFSQLGGLRALSKAPLIALTASAPPEIEQSILTSLHMRDPVIVRQELNRPNIYMSASRSMGVKVSLHCADFISYTNLFWYSVTLGD